MAGTLGSMAETVCPGRIPRRASAEASRRARSSNWRELMRCAPGTTAVRSGGIAAIRRRDATRVSGAEPAGGPGEAQRPRRVPLACFRCVALGDLRRHGLRMDQGIDVADIVRADDLGGAATGPFCRVGANAVIRPALQHRDTFQLVAGEMLWSTLHRFIARGAQEPGHGESLGQMLLVVPAIEFLLFVCRNVSPDHQQPCALLLGHRALLLLVQGDTTVSRPPEVG